MPKTNLYSISIPPMIKTLQVLSNLLDKAAAHAESKKTAHHEFEMKLLNDSIIFDQFDLKKQIQTCSDLAKGAAGRLAGIEIPKMADTETTVSELKARLEATVTYLKSIKPEDCMDKEEMQVTLPFIPNMHLHGFEYFTEFVIPNFYFHAATAYQIMRKNGVTIGKMDFVGGLPMKPTV